MITADGTWIAANAARAKKLIWLIEIEGYGKIFSTDNADATKKAWLETIDQITQSVDDVNGSTSLSELNFTVLDYNRLLTADFPGFTFEGGRVFLKQGFAGVAEADYVTFYTGVVDSVATDSDGATYSFRCVDVDRLNQQVIYQVGDDGQLTSEDHPRTLIGNPMDLLVSVLVNEVGFALGNVDTATIYAYRDALWGGIEFQFNVTSPPDAKSFIENELLKPLGGYGFTNNLGQYTVGFMQPQPGVIAAAFTFNETVLHAVPQWQQAALYNTLSYRFDIDDIKNGSGKFMAESIESDSLSVSTFGQQGQLVIESKGVRSGFQGFALVSMVASSIFHRYASKNPRFQLQSHWDAALLMVGDFVYLTHALVPNRITGGMGIVNGLFQILEKRISPLEGTLEWLLADASKIQAFGTARIAPDVTPDYGAASAYQQDRYLFITDVNGKHIDLTQGAAFA